MNESAKSIVQYGDYKGSPTISILKSEGDKFPFTFGLTKAKLILDHIDDIKKWVTEQTKGNIE